jgi:raffinose/stachyose/melibiose transport system substrate-binding protein
VRGLQRLVLVAMLAAATTIAACGGGTSDDSEGGGGEATLTLMAITDQQEAWDQAIAKFEKANPGIKIKPSYQAIDALQSTLRTRLGSGTAPDLFTVWPGNGNSMAVAQVAPTGGLADLSDQSWVSRVPGNLKELLGLDGKVVMWTPGSAVIGGVYNKPVFKQAGVKIPKTWDEMLAACDKLKAAGKIPIAVGNQTPWVTQLIDYAIAPSTAFVEDPELAENMLAGEATFADSGWRDVLERYLELSERGCYQPNPNGTTLERQEALVASGKAGMAVHISTIASTIAQNAKNSSDIAMFPFPANDEPGDLKIPAGLSSGIGVSAKSKNADAAKKFVEFLGEAENTRTFAEANQNIPIDVEEDTEVNPLVKPFVSFYTEEKTVPFMDQQWPNADVQQVHFAMAQDLLADKVSVDEALAKLDEAYKKK